MIEPDQIRTALVRQWQRIGSSVPGLGLDRWSRIPGWRNREVLAHLYVQPLLLGRFLRTAATTSPPLDLTTNLSGTAGYGTLIDASAREGAAMGKVDLTASVGRILPELMAAPLDVTIVTVQGPIRLADYLVTRCVEAVVHGGDLVDPAEPDPDAQAVTADALMAVLSTTAPERVAAARRLPPATWIDAATGRRAAPDELASVLPVMS
ncbi:MAG TPA: maleylpyruvate isomerase N-terminal domain-containing protein [Acidimicrobiales bacterium]|nr:maleylpyruvate isomerase N-terminal domain-containing protein [Acidimicrobiales bacterium]